MFKKKTVNVTEEEEEEKDSGKHRFFSTNGNPRKRVGFPGICTEV